MKVIHLINLHRFRGGADVVAVKTAELLKTHGHEAMLLTRDSRLLGDGIAGRAQAFFGGFYSRAGRRLVRETIRAERPDVVHIHDVYPLFSPWVLRDCAQAGVPVVMTCHDFRLTCPAGTHTCGGKVCERCSKGSEFWCAIKNCRGNRFESTAYALRSFVARRLRLFLDNVTEFIAPTAFVKQKLVAAGFPADRMTTVPYSVEVAPSSVQCASNDYVAYVGRFVPEKGIDTMIEAARMTGYELRMAGDWRPMRRLAETAPKNARFLGELGAEDVTALYRGARFLVFPSIWFETFGLVMAEAMSNGVPVVASRLGVMPDVVDDGVTGLLFNPGDADDLAEKMRKMWEDPELCGRMGRAAREKVMRTYTEDAYFDGIMKVYERAIRRNRKDAT
jgi:glycosyltransferase involved in cell wall biosynthesis